MIELDGKKTYRMTEVTDLEGKDKVHSRELYMTRINCIAENIHYEDVCGKDEKGQYHEGKVIRMDFIQNEHGDWIRKKLRTSLVSKVEKEGEQLKIHTMNSIYSFREAAVKPPLYQDRAELIELYLSSDSEYRFAKGFYYDREKKPHELEHYVHLGMFTDSVLVRLKENDIDYEWGYVCRYFPGSESVEFYDTIYGQQDYSLPILIHNTGMDALEVRCQFYKKEWIIPPGESRTVGPFDKGIRRAEGGE